MWQRVLATNQRLVEAAYHVLSANSMDWASAADFKLWLTERNDQVFYLATDKYQLVLGIRLDRDGRWRGSIAGMNGDLSLAALRELLTKAVDFLKEHNAGSLVFRVRNLPPSNRFSMAYQMALGLAHGHPAISTVTQEDFGRSREYVLTLRRTAA